MLMRKIKKVLKWLGAMLLVFVISFLGTAAANDSLSVDQILTGTKQIVSLGENQVSQLKDTGKSKISDDDEADTTAQEQDTNENSLSQNTIDIESNSTLNRLERVFFLKQAVNARINSANYVKLQDIPESMQQAVVAVEDRKFYNHWGFDMEGIFRASLVNLQYGQVKEGASTITQQLVKNLFLSQEQTMGRKAEEFVLAMDMELNYSKDEILELYLNTIYFGSGYYGIKEASEGYFGKEPAMLALPESAMLAGIPNAPSLYSPYVDFMLAKKRQFIVLDAMTAAGYLRESVADDAKIKPIYLAH